MKETVDPRAARTRTIGVDAALRILSTSGIAELTHVNLARESGIGRSTLYRHWPTTNDLILDLLEDFRMPDFEPAEGTLRERLKHNLVVQAAHLYDREYRVTYHAVQGSALESRIRARLVEVNQERIASVAAVLRPEYELGDDPDTITEMLALMNGPLLQMATFVGPASEALSETVLDSVLAYLDRLAP